MQKNKYTIHTANGQQFSYIAENIETAIEKLRNETTTEADNIINIAVNIGAQNKFKSNDQTPIEDLLNYVKRPSVTRESVIKYAEKLLSLEQKANQTTF